LCGKIVSGILAGSGAIVPAMNLFLIGYRCTGKTSVGKALSQKLRLAFVDADQLLIQNERKTIAEMVDINGWAYFRRQEKEIMQSICRRDGQVVATGGGVVLDSGNVTVMKNCGRLVWLRANPETIRKRMQQDNLTAGQRPALTCRGASIEIESVLKERTSYYRAAMDFSIDTDGRSIKDICRMIVNSLING
jgi:shikimate kinase